MADPRRILTLRMKIFRGDELLEEREISESSVSIGRAETAVLRIDDASLGELHAVINLEEDGTVQLLDLGTEAGTQHNGKSVSNVSLLSGDAITLGEIRVELTFDGPEQTTPTVDVRPDPALDEEHDALDEKAEDVLAMVMRSGTGSGTMGLDVKAPKVLEVNQIWHNVLVDSKHFHPGGDVTIGDAVGFRWSFLGIPLGWVSSTFATPLRFSPPIWSDVRSDWRNDFYASDENLPAGKEEFKLFRSEGKSYVARVSSAWEVFADVGEERLTLEDLVKKGLAKASGEITEITMTENLRLFVDIDHVVFIASMVAPGARVVGAVRDGSETPFLASLGVFGALGILMTIFIVTSPKPPANDMLDVEDRFVELLLEKPEAAEEEKKDKGPEDANKDAGEGAKAKEEEGKVGKQDAKMDKAKGNKREFNDQQRDREIAENAGVLGALNDGGAMDGVFGSGGLDPNLAGGIGGLVGAKGVQMGSGGLGSRGSGFGGGGTADGLGGLGTKGTGSGSSGYGSGGGSFGTKGSGGLSAVSGDPIIMGALDRSLIDQVIKRKMQAIRYCYQRELQKDPTLAGKVVIKFTIAKDGTVSQAAAKENSTGSKAVDSCVTNVFYKMQFPEPKGGGIVIVSYPFIFSPG